MRLLYKIKNLLKARSAGQGYTLFIPKLEIYAGARLALTGLSGCGKSTTLDLLGLALASDQAEEFSFCPAEIPYDIHSLYAQHKLEQLAKLRKQYLGYVLQTGELLPYLSTLENMTLCAQMAGIPKKVALERAQNLAKRLGLAKLLRLDPGKLSLGERQRVAIARALLPKPPILLADEPTAALDPINAETVMAELLTLVAEEGTTLILVTHDLALLKRYNLVNLTYHLEERETGVLAVLESFPKSAAADLSVF